MPATSDQKVTSANHPSILNASQGKRIYAHEDYGLERWTKMFDALAQQIKHVLPSWARRNGIELHLTASRSPTISYLVQRAR